MDLVIQNISDLPFIDHIDNNGDGMIQRMRIFFTNGEELSIVHGFGTYGNVDHPYEIMASNEEFYDEEDSDGYGVVGYCDKEKVMHYINKIGSFKKQLSE